MDFLGPNYLKSHHLSISADSMLQFVLKGRQQSDTLYPGQSTLHLQDYYATNYASIFETVSKAEMGRRDYDSIVVSTCYDTRARDIYRQAVQSNADGEDIAIVNRINELLLELDNFHSYFPDKKDAYRELFELYLSQDVLTEPYVADSLSYSDLRAKLSDENQVLVNIFKGSVDYLVYTFDGVQFDQHTIPVGEIDSIGRVYYDDIINGKGQVKAPLLTENILQLTDDSEVVLVPDGVFSKLPTQSIFGDRVVHSFTNVKAYMDADEIDISGGRVGLYTYSDERTLGNHEVKIYPELPYSLVEVQEIENVMSALDINVTSSSSSLDHTGLSLLHLSTHAYSSSSNRLDNFLLYREGGEVTKAYGFNIYQERELPEVVVLSACETGWGMHAYGAGVQTLSRAFLDNGTKSVIKTLWKVNEQATAEFMINMYIYWSTGISLHEALEKVKSDFRNHDQYSAPFYWAGFVLEGNPDVYLSKRER